MNNKSCLFPIALTPDKIDALINKGYLEYIEGWDDPIGEKNTLVVTLKGFEIIDEFMQNLANLGD